MKNFKMLPLLSVVALFSTLSNIKADQSKAFTYQINFEAHSEFHFTGNTPPLNAALMNQLRNDARVMAELACRGMLGFYDRLEKTGPEQVSESILTYHYKVPFTCGRQILSYSEVTPYLARFVATEKDFVLVEIARIQLVNIQDESVAPLLGLLNSPDYSEPQKIKVIRSLGGLLRQQTSHDFKILKQLLNRINENSMLAYEAAEAFGKSYRATYFLKQNINTLSHITLAKAIASIVRTYKVGSSYEPGLDLIEIPLNSSLVDAVAVALDSLSTRGVTENEMRLLLTRLTGLANIDKPVHPEVFSVLALEVSNRTLAPLLDAISPKLLLSEKGQSFVFQAMIALRKFTKMSEVQSVLPQLREIAMSTINPQNEYIQRLAKQLITAITLNG